MSDSFDYSGLILGSIDKSNIMKKIPFVEKIENSKTLINKLNY